LHNFVGPLFIVCSLLLFFTFLNKNFFERRDWEWIKTGGGLVSHKHVRAGYFNAGEKIWFWGGVVLLGLVMSISGLILDFVTFGQTRYVLQWANYLHIGGATLYIVGALAHIYMGTLADPLAYRAMRHGTVDAEWAREHHEYWYDELRGGVPPRTPPPDVPPHPQHR
jgi:formate dehydrogenase subunit gamma